MTLMNTIYSKYNRERSQEFQVETIIMRSSNDKRIVKKRPLSSKSSLHIKNIYANYFLLCELYKDTNLKIVPVKLVSDGVEFPYIEGESIDFILLNTLLTNGKDSFLKEVVKYYDFINDICGNRKETGEFISDEKFYEIFGQHVTIPNSTWVNTTNIDMTFDNILKNEDGELCLIDYEWVFNIKIPLSFVMYRSISNFYIKHNEYVQNIISKDFVFDYIGINAEIRLVFKKMESKFQQFVFGEANIFKIPINYIQERTNLETLIQEQDEYKKKCLQMENEKHNLLEKLSQINEQLNEYSMTSQKYKAEVDALSNQNKELTEQVHCFTKTLEEKENKISSLKKDLLHTTEIINEHIKSSIEIERELNLIKESHGYSFLLKYYNLRDRLLPANSRRRQLGKLSVKFMGNPSLFFKQFNKSNVKKSIYYLRKGNLQSLLSRVNNTIDTNEQVIDIVDKSNQSQNYFLKVVKSEHANFSKEINTSTLIDIIVPIYNAVDFLKKCIDSVFRNTDLNYNLFLINDCSPDEQINDYLEKLKLIEKPLNLESINIIHNEYNLGFVGNVNKGLSISKNHAVILNTDTEVPKNWLSRLINPVIEDDSISSVTPFSNSATICSFPKFCEDNDIPKNLNVDSLDELFVKYGSDELITLPTGVGFCMALNRNVLDRIGLFDAEAFGKGYGEENDWCMRAHKEGFKNVLVQNLFVYHKHGVSFSQTSDKKRDKRIEENLRIVEERHPEYIPWVHRFIKEDTIKPVRDVIISAAIAKSEADKQGYLFINHSMGGGTQLYQDQLISKIKDEVRVYTLTLINNNIIIEDRTGEDVRHYILGEEQLTQSVFNNIVELLNINLIYINQLVTFSPFKMMDFIKGTNLKYICFIHDYFWACPSYCLINSKEQYCFANTNIDQCKKCIGDKLITEPWINMKKSEIDIEKWREYFSSFLQGAYKVISPSGATKKIVNSYYPEVEIEVVEHELLTKVYNTFNEDNLKKSNLVVAFIGAIGEQKGSNIIYELKDLINKARLPIKLKVIGVTNIHQSSYKSEDGILEILGKYDKDEISKILRASNASVVVIPALWPETFSYTTSESIMSGYPVITFNIGAPAERVIRDDVGWVTDKINSKSLFELLKELNEDRDQILNKAKNIRKILKR